MWACRRDFLEFRQIVERQGQKLRQLSFDELVQLSSAPSENILVNGRPATISIIVEKKPGNLLRIVVQGFMRFRFLPGKHVALDGFYKSPDGSVKVMSDKEFYEFD